MTRYQRGDVDAFQLLYDRHAGRVLGYLRRRARPQFESEDLLQKVFLKVHEHRFRYNAERPFLPWLFSITRNTLIDAWRKQAEVRVEPGKLATIADRQSAAHAAAERPSRWNWEELMRMLPEPQRELVELRFAEGLSYEEIAAKVEVTEVSARKRVNRAVQALREFLGSGKREVRG